MIEDRLLFEKGTMNLVVGPTGSGKTSLLLALLGGLLLFAISLVLTRPQGSFTSYPPILRNRGIIYPGPEASLTPHRKVGC
jgi:energy-coupling factor transporter ATP-binding protein EcfA2